MRVCWTSKMNYLLHRKCIRNCLRNDVQRSHVACYEQLIHRTFSYLVRHKFGQKPFSLKFNLISIGKHTVKFGLKFSVLFFCGKKSSSSITKTIFRMNALAPNHSQAILCSPYSWKCAYFRPNECSLFLGFQRGRHCCYNIRSGIQ